MWLGHQILLWLLFDQDYLLDDSLTQVRGLDCKPWEISEKCLPLGWFLVHITLWFTQELDMCTFAFFRPSSSFFLGSTMYNMTGFSALYVVNYKPWETSENAFLCVDFGAICLEVTTDVRFLSGPGNYVTKKMCKRVTVSEFDIQFRLHVRRRVESTTRVVSATRRLITWNYLFLNAVGESASLSTARYI